MRLGRTSEVLHGEQVKVDAVLAIAADAVALVRKGGSRRNLCHLDPHTTRPSYVTISDWCWRLELVPVSDQVLAQPAAVSSARGPTRHQHRERPSREAGRAELPAMAWLQAPALQTVLQ